MKSWATDKDDATVDPVFGKVGKQRIENTGPLTKKRMETVDEEFIGAALDFMERKSKEDAPWFCYFNPTRMHVFTHLKPASVGVTGHGLYPDGMVELDGYVGQLLQKLDDLKVAENTMVVFTTDNGAEVLSWPDGGATPFRGEKDTNWEGGWRVPCVVRWPAVIKPGEVINEMASLTDFIPTFAAAAGETDLVAKVKKGYQIGDTKFKVHLDGFNLLPFLSGKEKKSPREGFVYWSDQGELMALRVRQYKIVFAEQRAKGLDVWREPLSLMRIPKMFDLRSDPFERGEESFKYNDWFIEHVPYQYLAQAVVHEWMESFKEFPPRQRPASFSIDQIVEKLMPKDRLLLLLGSRAGQDAGETDVPFVTAGLVDHFIRAPEAVLQRPRLGERLRVRDSQPVVDGVVVDAGEAFDQLEILRGTMKPPAAVEVRRLDNERLALPPAA